MKILNLVKQLGFGGKACIHPDQIEISNKNILMKKLRLVLQVGLMGKQHLIAIKKSNRASLHSIIDINKTSIKFAKQYRVPLYTNSKAILGTDKPDAVIVATPNQFHESIQ